MQKRHGWVRLHEKGGKVTDLPCQHNLDRYLEEWISPSGLGTESEAPLFPTLRHGRLTDRTPLPRPNVYMMIERRARTAGLRTEISAHTSAPPGSPLTCRTAASSRSLSRWPVTNHRVPPGLYDRRNDQIALDEVERIAY